MITVKNGTPFPGSQKGLILQQLRAEDRIIISDDLSTVRTCRIRNLIPIQVSDLHLYGLLKHFFSH